jgi:signal transduction histidine kinase
MQNRQSQSTIIRVDNHPFPLLLYLEWILLGLAFLTELLPVNPLIESSYVLTVTTILIFWGMGFYIPIQGKKIKILYAAIEMVILAINSIGNTRLFSLLLIVLCIRSCLMFGLVGRVSVGLLACIFFVITIYQRMQILSSLPLTIQVERIQQIFLSFSILFALSIIFLFMLINSLLVERQSRDQLAEANEQLRHYAARIEALATVQERNRIAREIHDSLGHTLTALNIQLEGAQKLWQSRPEQAQTFLQEAKQLGSTALQEVRHSVGALRADPIGLSLLDALQKLLETMPKNSDLTLTSHLDLDPKLAFPLEVRIALYRITQEALTNIYKYAKATEVTIYLFQDTEGLHLHVKDNGIGFNREETRRGFGIQGMEERVKALNGSFQLQTSPGRGCQIKVRIPVGLRVTS